MNQTTKNASPDDSIEMIEVDISETVIILLFVFGFLIMLLFCILCIRKCVLCGITQSKNKNSTSEDSDATPPPYNETISCDPVVAFMQSLQETTSVQNASVSTVSCVLPIENNYHCSINPNNAQKSANDEPTRPNSMFKSSESNVEEGRNHSRKAVTFNA